MGHGRIQSNASLRRANASCEEDAVHYSRSPLRDAGEVGRTGKWERTKLQCDLLVAGFVTRKHTNPFSQTDSNFLSRITGSIAEIYVRHRDHPTIDGHEPPVVASSGLRTRPGPRPQGTTNKQSQPRSFSFPLRRRRINPNSISFLLPESQPPFPAYISAAPP